MPKINRAVLPAPMVRKTSLGSTVAELGEFRLLLHDKQYSVSTSNKSFHRERFLEGKGWCMIDTIPGRIEEVLKKALGL